MIFYAQQAKQTDTPTFYNFRHTIPTQHQIMNGRYTPQTQRLQVSLQDTFAGAAGQGLICLLDTTGRKWPC